MNKRIALLITGNVRESLIHNNILNIIDNLKKNFILDIFCLPNLKYEHKSITWHNKLYKNLDTLNVEISHIHPNYINCKKIVIDEEQTFENINKLWGKSPCSYEAVYYMWKNIKKCYDLLNEDYDIIIRTRFDLYKFDYCNYTDKILDVLNDFNSNKFDFNNFNMIKINGERGEDLFFFSNKENFKNIIYSINNNFKENEIYAQNYNYYFMPEDLLIFTCQNENIPYNLI